MKKEVVISVRLLILAQLFISFAGSAQWSATQAFYGNSEFSFTEVGMFDNYMVYIGGINLSTETQNMVIGLTDLSLNSCTLFQLTTGGYNELKSVFPLPSGNLGVIGKSLIPEGFGFWNSSFYLELSPSGFPILFKEWGSVNNSIFFHDAMLDGNSVVSCWWRRNNVWDG